MTGPLNVLVLCRDTLYEHKWGVNEHVTFKNHWRTMSPPCNVFASSPTTKGGKEDGIFFVSGNTWCRTSILTMSIDTRTGIFHCHKTLGLTRPTSPFIPDHCWNLGIHKSKAYVLDKSTDGDGTILIYDIPIPGNKFGRLIQLCPIRLYLGNGRRRKGRMKGCAIMEDGSICLFVAYNYYEPLEIQRFLLPL